jgi:hypothetical protein
MKWFSLVFFVLFPFLSGAQIIVTVAGNGTPTTSGDGGPAISAGIYTPNFLAFDGHGNLYVGQGIFNRVRRIDPSGIISTFAGTGTAGYMGDGGPASAAQIDGIADINTDTHNNLYICDLGNNCVRKVNAVTGIIATIAGTGTAGYSGDGGPATSARLNRPADVLVDKNGNIYIADNSNRRVRKVDTFGIITTIAGIGNVPYGYGGDGGPADTTAISVVGICMDDTGNLYIADHHSRVLKVDTFGIIRTYAGNGIGGSDGDGGLATTAGITPFKISLDRYNNLYISEWVGSGGGPHKVRKVSVTMGIITTVAGTDTEGFSGDGGPATAAQLSRVASTAFDTCGNMYIGCSGNNRIRKVLFYPDCPDTTEGGGADTTVGSNLQNTNSTVSLFPNPANDELHITGTNIEAYSIAAFTGKTLLQGTVHKGDNSIPLKSLPPGTYLITITNASGEKTVRKILKE